MSDNPNTIEHSCLLCKDTYYLYNDPFVIVIDTSTFIEMTNDLCLKCVKSFHNCNECNRELNEPWEVVYFNISDKTYYCGCCYNDSRNNFYKKCHCTDCKYCVEKYNIKPYVIKPTSPFLEYPPKKRKQNNLKL